MGRVGVVTVRAAGRCRNQSEYQSEPDVSGPAINTTGASSGDARSRARLQELVEELFSVGPRALGPDFRTTMSLQELAQACRGSFHC